MTKTELIKAVARNNYSDFSINQKQASEIVNAILDTIGTGLLEDKSVQITGFGTFKTHEVAEHMGHNPKNKNEKILIPAYTQVTFSSGSELRSKINVK